MKKIIIVVVCIIILLIGIGSCSANNNQVSDQSGSENQEQQVQAQDENTWDANTDLFGMTVESAWDEIESHGYSMGSILSITGAELNNDESIRHSSTAKTWLVSKAEIDESSKAVTIEVTSRDQFIDEFGKEFVK